ncbi:protein farnesyltransferase subunit beta [Anaeramoeba ignava]|uniref:Protein farnesyltransferase subunit beta n=1 Tax=Anaeramoeba ignava TaxID=1746090 RepID=A0A9Q0LQP8_ANAIG|nr:protein farnesyltransferase subunit beta [Anaeramoeba ignava]
MAEATLKKPEFSTPQSCFTKTYVDQKFLETSILRRYDLFREDPEYSEKIRLIRDEHKEYLHKSARGLSEGYQELDASQPWFCYWILNSLDLLGVLDDTSSFVYKENLFEKTIYTIARCQGELGGFGGGPLQDSHLAPTYAAVNALAIVQKYHKGALDIIDSKKMFSFLLSLKQPDGSFAMHIGGERDLRGLYCALSVAYLLNIQTEELIKDSELFVKSCQTYEGGLASVPFAEAHGGYTFCGVAALGLLGKMEVIDVDSLFQWLVNRQMKFSGGFQGRTNKLVDGCYSWWQGGAFPLVVDYIQKRDGISLQNNNNGDWAFHQFALQQFILSCCQQPDGGLRDKPEKNRDLYHTSYCLSGLSRSQYNTFSKTTTVLGIKENLLKEIDHIHCIPVDKVEVAKLHFQNSKLEENKN